MQNYFPPSGILRSILGFGGDVSKVWEELSPMKVSDITGPDAPTKVSRLVKPEVLQRVRADIARVLREYPTMSATNATVEEVFKVGVTEGILRNTVNT